MGDVAASQGKRLWLNDLRAAGPDGERRRTEALEDLRKVLRRGLSRALASRGQATHVLEDFVQEALLRILERMDDYRGDSEFTTWAMAIAIRVAFTEMRRARWRDVSLDEMLGGGETAAITALFAAPAEVEEDLHRRQVTGALRQVLDQLGTRQRSVVLGELAGVPKSVLAERLGTNNNALYKASHDARRRLRLGLLATGLSEDEIRAAIRR